MRRTPRWNALDNEIRLIEESYSGSGVVALVGPEVSFKIAKLGFEEISRLTIAVHTLYDPKDG